MTVSPANDGVTAASDTYTVAEDGSVALDLLANDQAPDGGARVVSINGVALVGGAQTIVVDHGVVQVAADGSLSFVPDANYNGPASFEYVMADADGDTDTATVDIDVTPVNDAPTPADPNAGLDPTDPSYVPGQTFDPTTGEYSLVTPEDVPVTGRVVGSDLDGDALSYTKGSDPAHGTVVVNPDGTYVYTPAADYNGTDTFTVTIEDGHGGTVTSTVTVTVTPVNDVPVPVDPNEGLEPSDPGYLPGQSFDPSTGNYALVTPEDVAVDGKVVATDADGDALTYAKGTDPSHGTVVVNADGTYTYTPDADFNGDDTFTVTIDDGQGGTTTSTVTVTVTPVNDPPLFVDGGGLPVDPSVGYAFSYAENQPAGAVLASVQARDADGQTLTYSIASGNENGWYAIDPATGAITLTAAGAVAAANDFEAGSPVHALVVQVSDGLAAVTIPVTLTERDANDPPSATPDALATAEDTALTIPPATLLGNDSDPDGNALTIASVQDAVNGTVAIVDGNVVFTPDPDFHGAASFTYTISDGQGGSSTATVTVDVTPVNDGVTATNDTYTVAEDGAVALDLLANDQAPDGGARLVSINGVALVGGTQTIVVDHGVVQVAADGSLSFVPDPNYNGPAAFDYVMADADGDTGTATVTISVTPVNDAPVVSPVQPVTTPEDQPVTGQVLASDPEGDVLTYGLASGGAPAHGTVVVNAANGSFTYTPAPDYSGADSFTVSVSDGQGGVTNVIVPINVTPVTDAVEISQQIEFNVQGTQFTTYTWNNISTVTDGSTTYNLTENGGDGATSETLVSAIDYLYANQQGSAVVGQTTSLENNNLPTLQAKLITGYVFLEAGKTYAFTGSVDDSGTIVIGDAASGHASWGGVSGGGANSKFTVDTSGFYTFDLYLHNAAGVGNYDFSVTEEGGGAVQMFGSLADIQNALAPYDYLGLRGFDDGADADGNGFYGLEYGFNGASGSAIAFTGIDVAATDRDGSEQLSMTLSGLTAGSVLTYTSVQADGSTSVQTVAAEADGSIQVTGIAGAVEFRDISVTLPEAGNHNVTLVATTQDGASAPQTSSFDFLVNATPPEAFLMASSQDANDAGLPAISELFSGRGETLDALFALNAPSGATSWEPQRAGLQEGEVSWHAPLPPSPLEDQLQHVVHA